jgi:hypothetical protein
VLLIISFENWSQKALSVGRHLAIEGEVAHQGLRFWMVEKLGSVMGLAWHGVLKGLLREGKAEPSPFMLPRRIPPEVDASKSD